ncbi:MAG: HD domain-containing protein [Bdellovibrionales bacterium]|nr:HD domain-containing protein [Bdellovibrionales bacterium]
MSLSWGSLPQKFLDEVTRIMQELEIYDKGVHDHCVRVSHMSRFLAEAMQLSSYDQLVAQFAGLLHDAGKMKTPLNIVNKPSKLTDEEYDVIRRHPIASAELLEPLEKSSFFREVQVAVLHHHERVDGLGYPFGLSGEQIPFISRLILVVDTVDAMTETRPYRKGLPVEVAYQELIKFSGKQFDSELVKVFIAAHRKTEMEQMAPNVLQFPIKKAA